MSDPSTRNSALAQRLYEEDQARKAQMKSFYRITSPKSRRQQRAADQLKRIDGSEHNPVDRRA